MADTVLSENGAQKLACGFKCAACQCQTCQALNGCPVHVQHCTPAQPVSLFTVQVCRSCGQMTLGTLAISGVDRIGLCAECGALSRVA